MDSQLDIDFGPEILHDFERASGREWLETNGLGGWASSTLSGAHTRRYHGLLVAATQPPVGRMVLLSRLDEALVVAGGRRYELGANRFPGSVHPQGHLLQTRFTQGLFPTWELEAGGVKLRKTVACPNGESTTLVLYEVLEAPGEVQVELRPFFAGRDYHWLLGENDRVAREARFADGVLSYRPYPETPTVTIEAAGASWMPGPDWWRAFEYDRERERGFDFHEDLFTPGWLIVRLQPGERIGIRATTEARPYGDPWSSFAAEARRRAGMLSRLGWSDPTARRLALAADQFVARRGSGDGKTILAGYPWFTDWGRDTLISLPGLCLSTGRYAEAKSILRTFAAAVDQAPGGAGMVPNRFPDGGEAAEYNTVDASLWLFVAVDAYLAATGDEAFVQVEMAPVLDAILGAYTRGTLHGIREDADGLLRAGEPGVQLTWMDAKVGDRVITPRHGKPVEIQALWHSALSIRADLADRAGDAVRAKELRSRARRVKRRFLELFWNAAGGYLYDVVGDGDDPPRDAALRPNQLLALSLPHPLLSGSLARRAFRRVEEALLTPVGLRSLDPADPAYVGVYQGGATERDTAYHQGTVWSWLLGPYLSALVRLYGEAGRRQGRAFWTGLRAQLEDGGLGTIAEIFDGDAPHPSRGCFAQAWGVAELLRAATQDLGLAAAPPADAGRPVKVVAAPA